MYGLIWMVKILLSCHKETVTHVGGSQLCVLQQGGACISVSIMWTSSEPAVIQEGVSTVQHAVHACAAGCSALSKICWPIESSVQPLGAMHKADSALVSNPPYAASPWRPCL